MNNLVNSDALVVYKETGEIVPFVFIENGEIKINSVNPDHTDETCIVTTWKNLISLNTMRRDKIGKNNK